MPGNRDNLSAVKWPINGTDAVTAREIYRMTSQRYDVTAETAIDHTGSVTQQLVLNVE